MTASYWRPTIKALLLELWPERAKDFAAWIEGQCDRESAGNPKAVSPSGARGLMQLMPATGKEMGLQTDADFFDPQKNLRAGILYLKRQYDSLPYLTERAGVRLSWATAAYNGGRAYVLKANELAGRDGGTDWPTWSVGRYWLMHRDCYVRNRAGLKRWPDYRQIWGYVEAIRKNELAILNESPGDVRLAGGMR